MTEDIRQEITRLLGKLADSDLDQPAVRNRLFVILYGELRGLAGDLMRRERRDHTLQPTALVNEAYLRLVRDPALEWKSRAHFMGIAAMAMRRILVEHARQRAAAKRGGGSERIPLEEAARQAAAQPSLDDGEILDLDRALDALAALDERAARVVELRIFTGLEVREIAMVLGVSERTVHGDWRVAKMWLARELGDGERS